MRNMSMNPEEMNHGRGERRHACRDERGHRGHRDTDGMGPGFGGPGGRGGFGGRRGPTRRGGRGRRGDVRNTILALIAEEPRNGYQLIQAIAEKTDGLWTPGAGSVYPALGLLADEGLLLADEVEGKKIFRLTDEGASWMQEHADEVNEPWKRVTEGHEAELDVRKEVHQLALALEQVVLAGRPEQITQARAILDQARKDLYGVLAQ